MSKRRLTKKERDARDAQWLASIRRSIEEGNSIFNQGLAAALQMYGAMRGQLASVLHGVWAHWTGYMLSVGQENEDGSVTIPAEYVERWRRQMETPREFNFGDHGTVNVRYVRMNEGELRVVLNALVAQVKRDEKELGTWLLGVSEEDMESFRNAPAESYAGWWQNEMEQRATLQERLQKEFPAELATVQDCCRIVFVGVGILPSHHPGQRPCLAQVI